LSFCIQIRDVKSLNQSIGDNIIQSKHYAHVIKGKILFVSRVTPVKGG